MTARNYYDHVAGHKRPHACAFEVVEFDAPEPRDPGIEVIEHEPTPDAIAAFARAFARAEMTRWQK